MSDVLMCPAVYLPASPPGARVVWPSPPCPEKAEGRGRKHEAPGAALLPTSKAGCPDYRAVMVPPLMLNRLLENRAASSVLARSV
jgi:hypothetical protein